MTSAQLADELRIKESYLRTHWKRIVETYAKMGIQLVKMGRGEKADYGIKSYDDEYLRWVERPLNNKTKGEIVE